MPFPPSDEGGGTRAARDGGRDKPGQILEFRSQKRRAGACSRSKIKSGKDTRFGCAKNKIPARVVAGFHARPTQSDTDTRPGYNETKGQPKPFLPLTREVDLRRIFRRKDGGRDKPCQNSEFRNQKSERVVAGFPSAGLGAAPKRRFCRRSVFSHAKRPVARLFAQHSRSRRRNRSVLTRSGPARTAFSIKPL